VAGRSHDEDGVLSIISKVINAFATLGVIATVAAAGAAIRGKAAQAAGREVVVHGVVIFGRTILPQVFKVKPPDPWEEEVNRAIHGNPMPPEKRSNPPWRLQDLEVKKAQ
jgi:hypothetical protein